MMSKVTHLPKPAWYLHMWKTTCMCCSSVLCDKLPESCFFLKLGSGCVTWHHVCRSDCTAQTSSTGKTWAGGKQVPQLCYGATEQCWNTTHEQSDLMWSVYDSVADPRSTDTALWEAATWSEQRQQNGWITAYRFAAFPHGSPARKVREPLPLLIISPKLPAQPVLFKNSRSSDCGCMARIIVPCQSNIMLKKLPIIYWRACYTEWLNSTHLCSSKRLFKVLKPCLLSENNLRNCPEEDYKSEDFNLKSCLVESVHPSPIIFLAAGCDSPASY